MCRDTLPTLPPSSHTLRCNPSSIFISIEHNFLSLNTHTSSCPRAFAFGGFLSPNVHVAAAHTSFWFQFKYHLFPKGSRPALPPHNQPTETATLPSSQPPCTLQCFSPRVVSTLTRHSRKSQLDSMTGISNGRDTRWWWHSMTHRAAPPQSLSPKSTDWESSLSEYFFSWTFSVAERMCVFPLKWELSSGLLYATSITPTIISETPMTWKFTAHEFSAWPKLRSPRRWQVDFK